MPENFFDERIAATYDTKWADQFAPSFVDPAVDFLADLAGNGSALELGIGTGRVALPLSRRGVRVHGIELSPAMVEQLRAKPGADDIGVTIGDFASAKVDGTFALAYLVRNTIMNLTTQDEQVACFRNVAAHLEPGGCFVLEVIVPTLRQLPPGETVRAFTVTPTHLGFDEYVDLASQSSVSHHYWVVDGRLETFSAPFRYVWPSELDLMARLAGMTLRERWADWNREPFTGESPIHVSVWERPRSRPSDTAEVRKQYHFWPGENGLDAWDVDRLVELSRGLPMKQVALESIDEIDSVYWFDDQGERPTVRRVVDHARLIEEVDLSYPIILGRDGRVMDGMHRIAKALLEDRPTIDAVQFETPLEPDYRNCRPEELPY